MRKPLNILLVTNHRRFKINFRAYPWARALADRGHTVDVMCHADTERWKTFYEKQRGFRIIQNPDVLVGALRQGWDPVCAFRRGVLLFRERKAYDIIHCLDTRPAVVLPSLVYGRAMRIPVVSDWIDWWGRGGLIKERRPLWYRFLFGRFETFFEEYFRNKLDGLTTISHALLERGVKLGVPREKCLRIPGGANLSQFSNVPSREHCRKALKIAADAPVVCFSGLDVLMDLPLVMSAFERILITSPNAVLLLVGPTPELLKKLTSNAAMARQIVCTGPVPYASLAQYLAAADVFLMPYTNKISNIGRWPNKIGDYMCIGRPTVSNPVGEVKRLFELFEIGKLAEENPDSMAEAALSFLHNPELARRFGQQARLAAENVFAWEHLIEDLERWYYQILFNFAVPERENLHASVPRAASITMSRASRHQNNPR
jgi:glycosyltransferase involved in cell wall biosynthesis